MQNPGRFRQADQQFTHARRISFQQGLLDWDDERFRHNRRAPVPRPEYSDQPHPTVRSEAPEIRLFRLVRIPVYHRTRAIRACGMRPGCHRVTSVLERSVECPSLYMRMQIWLRRVG